MDKSIIKNNILWLVVYRDKFGTFTKIFNSKEEAQEYLEQVEQQINTYGYIYRCEQLA